MDSLSKKYGRCTGCVYILQRRWGFGKAKRLVETAIYASGHAIRITAAQALDGSGKTFSPGMITIKILSHYLLSWHLCRLRSNSLDDPRSPFRLSLPQGSVVLNISSLSQWIVTGAFVLRYLVNVSFKATEHLVLFNEPLESATCQRVGYSPYPQHLQLLPTPSLA